MKINLDIPNLEGNIDAEFTDNWVQQLESYYSMNQLSEAEKDHHCILKDVNLRTLMVGKFIDKDGKRRRPHRHMGKIYRVCTKGFLPSQVS